MKKSKKVTLVYLELKQALGDSASSEDLLDHAYSVVELFEEKPSTGSNYPVGRALFDERPLDSVMADGGWKVLCRAPKDTYECEPMEQFEWQTAWHQSGLADQFPGMRI